MSRIPYAAQQLIDQVAALKPGAEVTQSGDPDGLDVVREITFDGKTGDWLYPLLTAAGNGMVDERFAVLLHDSKGLQITFQAGTVADNADPFLLSEVEAVLNEPQENVNPEALAEITQPSAEPPPIKRTPAKKAPAKQAQRKGAK